MTIYGQLQAKMADKEGAKNQLEDKSVVTKIAVWVQQAATGTRTAKDTDSWTTLAEGNFLYWKDSEYNRIE